MNKIFRPFLASAMLALSATQAFAGLSYSTAGSVLVQNFDSLSNNGTSTWINDATLPGWFLFSQPAPGTAITAITAGTGSSNAGSFYSFGYAGSSERALGGVGSGGTYFGSTAGGAVAGWIAFSATNTTGGSLSSFNLTYDGEQWRNGGNTAAQTMVVEYGFGSTFQSVASWTAAGGAFNFTSPEASATAGAVDGNIAGRVASIGGTITKDWAADSTLWIRFVERNDTGNDHGLAIDNFSFSAFAPTPPVDDGGGNDNGNTNPPGTQPIPEPASASMLLMGVLGLGLARRRR